MLLEVSGMCGATPGASYPGYRLASRAASGPVSGSCRYGVSCQSRSGIADRNTPLKRTRDIRRAVEDDAQQLIRTVARRGYMFTAPVTTPAVEFPRQTGRETDYGPVPVPPVIRGAPQPLPDDVPPALRTVVEGQISKRLRTTI